MTRASERREYCVFVADSDGTLFILSVFFQIKAQITPEDSNATQASTEDRILLRSTKSLFTNLQKPFRTKPNN